jgi:hypothetical protein
MILFDLLQYLHGLRALHALSDVHGGGIIEAAAYGATLLYFVASSLISTAISMGVSALTAPNIKGPRQKDSGVQSEDYGAPIPRVWGPMTRLSGPVIYYSGLRETSRKQSGSGGSQTTFTYRCTAAILLGEGVPGAELVRVWANKKLIWDRGSSIGYLADGSLTVVESVTLHDGAADQAPDSTLEEEIGVGKVPAYRHRMYAVVRNLQLADFGPRLPYLEFEVSAHTTISPAEVVQEVCATAGVDVDVSLLDGAVQPLDGYAVTANVSVADAIAPLCGAYFFTICERGGVLVAIPDGMQPVARIPASDLSAAPAGGSDEGTPHERDPDSDLPRTVVVSYRDIARDLQPGTSRDSRPVGTSTEIQTIDVPLSMYANHAKRIAMRALWGAISARRTSKPRTTMRWLDVLPGDVVELQGPTGEYLPAKILRSSQGADGVIAWECSQDDAETTTGLCGTAEAEQTETTTPPRSGAGRSLFAGLDIPILRDADNNAGFYYAVTGRRRAWPGSLVFRSTDGGTDYEPMGQALRATAMGMIDLPIAPGPTYCWDRATRIVVQFDTPDVELETRSELAVLNGLGTVWVGPRSGIGGEILQFATATLVAPDTYELRDLLRGRRGTEWAVDRHGPGERLVVLSGANLARSDYGAADLDLSRLYKPVTAGAGLDDTDSTPFRNGGEGLRPFAPVRLVGRRRASGAVSISFVPRTRMMHGGFGGGPVPVGEAAQTFRLEIREPADVWAFDASYSIGDEVRELSPQDYQWRWYRARRNHTGNSRNRPDQVSENWRTHWTEIPALRTVHLGDQTTYEYTAAEQTADGITPGDALVLHCSQLSYVRGFGHPALSSVRMAA